jgi:hypothetical protein
MRAYQHRLGEKTKAKISRLDHAAHERSGIGPLIGL